MISYTKFTLSNGLTVLHHGDESTSMVAFNLVYDVGSRDEQPDKTGFAHLFEHLMFGGSKHIPSYDKLAHAAGAENNAYTNNDLTNYYLVLPKDNLEVAFQLESDRMLLLDFSAKGLEVQKQVVIEEFKERSLNQPYGDVSHLIRAMAYTVHPYAWPTIGKDPEHIRTASLSDVEAFFFRHYAPNNAVLSVVGNVSLDKTRLLAEKWFGSIPCREVPTRQLAQEPPQTQARFQEVVRQVPTNALYKVYPMCGRMEGDYPVYDMLSDILALGKSSRLYRRLVMEKKYFTKVNAYVSGSADPGLFYLTGKPANGIGLEEADSILQEEIHLLTTEAISSRELDKVKNKFESAHLFSNLHSLDKAGNLGLFELLGDAGLINEEITKYRSVQSEQLQSLARTAFAPERCSTLYYRAEK